MPFLDQYEELNPGNGFPKMRDHISDIPYSTKPYILEHLKSGTGHIATAARIYDCYTGEPVQGYGFLIHMNDGEYFWTNKLIYYIDRYNLRLPADIEENILKKCLPPCD